MEELIKIKTTGKGNHAINARDLHTYLGVKHVFSTWMKEYISKWGFVENQDYVRLYYDVYGNLLSTSNDKNVASDNQVHAHKIEYAIILDMAKELCMLQNSEKGRTARQYFITAEKKLRQLNALPQTETISIPEVARMYNMGINTFRGKMRYYGIFGNIKSDYRQYNRPYLKFIADGSFIADQPTRTKGLALINEVFLTGESLRESNDVQSKANQNKIDSMYSVVRTFAGLFYSSMEGSNLSPKRTAALLALSTAMHEADELFNQNKQKSLE